MKEGKSLVPLLSSIELCSCLQQGSSILSSFSLIKIWWLDGCIHVLKYQVIIFGFGFVLLVLSWVGGDSKSEG